MVTAWDTALPTLTSPKSIEAGLVTNGDEDEDPLKLDPFPPPQPETVRSVARAPAASRMMGPLARMLLRFWETSGEPAEISSTFKRQELRNSCIGDHLSHQSVFLGNPSKRTPLNSPRRWKISFSASAWATSRIDLDGHEVQVTIVTNVSYYCYLCTTAATCCTICS